MNRAFFFDRDGILVKNIYGYDLEYKRMMDGTPKKLDELQIFSVAKEIIDHVKGKGFLPIIITNQPDFLKGDVLLKHYEQINEKLCNELGLKRAHIFECLHKEGFSLECECRKPKSGLFLMAKGMHDINLENSWMIGDSWKDIVGANNAGIKNTIFLFRKAILGEQEGNEFSIKKLNELNIKPTHIIKDLSEVKDLIS